MQFEKDTCEKPLVSVIMSVFNESIDEIGRAIESILNQTYKNIEFIIVDDNPNNTLMLKILKEYNEKNNNIKLIINEKNLGLAKSLNKAIDIASGDFIARMDADDISALDRIEKEIKLLIENKYDMITSNCDYIDENGITIGHRNNLPLDVDCIKALLPYANFICHPSVIYKKKVINELGGYRSFSVSQDYDLWLRFLSAGFVIGSTNEVLLHYRTRQNSISAKNMIRRIVYIEYQKRLYRERLKHRSDSYTDDAVANLEKIVNKYSSNKEVFRLIENIQVSISERNVKNFIIDYFLAVAKRKKIIILWLNDLIKYTLMKGLHMTNKMFVSSFNKKPDQIDKIGRFNYIKLLNKLS